MTTPRKSIGKNFSDLSIAIMDATSPKVVDSNTHDIFARLMTAIATGAVTPENKPTPSTFSWMTTKVSSLIWTPVQESKSTSNIDVSVDPFNPKFYFQVQELVNSSKLYPAQRELLSLVSYFCRIARSLDFIHEHENKNISYQTALQTALMYEQTKSKPDIDSLILKIENYNKTCTEFYRSDLDEIVQDSFNLEIKHIKTETQELSREIDALELKIQNGNSLEQLTILKSDLEKKILSQKSKFKLFFETTPEKKDISRTIAAHPNFRRIEKTYQNLIEEIQTINNTYLDQQKSNTTIPDIAPQDLAHSFTIAKAQLADKTLSQKYIEDVFKKQKQSAQLEILKKITGNLLEEWTLESKGIIHQFPIAERIRKLSEDRKKLILKQSSLEAIRVGDAKQNQQILLDQNDKLQKQFKYFHPAIEEEYQIKFEAVKKTAKSQKNERETAFDALSTRLNQLNLKARINKKQTPTLQVISQSKYKPLPAAAPRPSLKNAKNHLKHAKRTGVASGFSFGSGAVLGLLFPIPIVGWIAAGVCAIIGTLFLCNAISNYRSYRTTKASTQPPASPPSPTTDRYNNASLHRTFPRIEEKPSQAPSATQGRPRLPSLELSDLSSNLLDNENHSPQHRLSLR